MIISIEDDSDDDDDDNDVDRGCNDGISSVGRPARYKLAMIVNLVDEEEHLLNIFSTFHITLIKMLTSSAQKGDAPVVRACK